ncbi:NAD(P)H-flavin reductase [Aliidiomarina quisquiliarum]|uniref:NAD(P)H-flavin reductase n=1 Tax=Aliidiomarina quisquiliarum TaxID=2938947 RepID=UPI00208FD45C|nr:NAD(P)H-flavin reductase [Aliidiomarina quisquiliarum]MCO4321087.1 NAD(P)H-flavin reductase [Aliidiomarina quisquiliarum]
MSNPTLTCQVSLIEPLTPFVFKVQLTPPEPVNFVAGQYITVVMDKDDFRAFSIASTPSQGHVIELHIGATPENPYAWEVMQRLQAEGEITITVPAGTAGLRESERPLIVLAGGTGFSYAWSIAAAQLETQSQRNVLFYWGGKTLADLYKHEKLLALEQSDSRFHYFPVLEKTPENWQGHQGLVHLAVLADHDNLSGFDVYVAGRFEMVRVVRDDFFKHKLPEQQLFGDALSYLE